ncbi:MULTISPECIES: maltokinase N-terminal cap-like domain-containing protein [unclassified Cryobacterium]|uniref:maltokinase N-terminal cap-like domain-containing protein n=1 Tax=unclassified Cryobacterium TaxID=2649013 RepID=UPI002AB36091|nr:MULTISPECIES: phosphotransferase [unclassified Cryobacterium]MDY7543466.1 phosphotransferase [Cryobacterium sp. 5B3]MEA9999526.1 phosphotransferase [Cryobacterium sp. RTS3]MEB0267027.1 phosphotransferase [Cryobacterium sp. 10I5]MEB0274645.1 phosphotransferase [Cryobacterium sp. 5B3]
MTANVLGSAVSAEVSSWAARQRWFSDTGHPVALSRVGGWTLPSGEPGVLIRTDCVVDAGDPRRTVYQLPVTEREVALPGGEAALITISTGADGRQRFVYDAPADPAYARALLLLILRRGTSGPGADGFSVAEGETLSNGLAGGEPADRVAPGGVEPTVVSSQVLRGEQSNTSIIYELAGPDGRNLTPVICKVFRALHHGDNPDVTVQSALARAGSRFVPVPVGCVVGDWADARAPDGTARGHLAFAQEFLPEVEDAWRVVLGAAGRNEDFTARARSLGVATAAVHADLADAMPTAEPTPEVVDAVLDGLRARARRAIAEVPALDRYAPAIDAVFTAAAQVSWPRLQRIHGDLHLGQVLLVPGRGWVLVDFEGEPLSPLEDRTRVDVPWRDVAGMLRSFSYAAGTVAREAPERTDAVTGWAQACRRAFLAGYSERSGRSLGEQRPLLDAFELDKALYEVVYEKLNRPDWLPIPLAAIDALLSQEPAPVRESG